MYFINKVDVIKDDEKIAAQVVIKNDVTGDTEVIFLNQEQYNKLCEEMEYIKENCVVEEELIDTINEITTADKGVNAMTLNSHKDTEFAKSEHAHNNLTDLNTFNNHVEKKGSDKTIGHSAVISNPNPELRYNNFAAASANIVAQHTGRLNQAVEAVNKHIITYSSDTVVGHAFVIQEPTTKMSYKPYAAAGANIVAKHTEDIAATKTTVAKHTEDIAATKTTVAKHTEELSLINKLLKDEAYIITKDYVWPSSDNSPHFKATFRDNNDNPITNRIVQINIISQGTGSIHRTYRTNSDGVVEFMLEKWDLSNGVHSIVWELRNNNDTNTILTVIKHIFKRDSY